MQWADLRRADPHRVLVLALLCCALGAQAQEPSTYGKVETFEPGKKYSCVPTPDRKGWDCTQTGKASEKSPAQPQPAPEMPTPAPVSAVRSEAPAAVATAPTPSAPPAAPTPRASELPSYLSARSSGAAAPNAPAPTSPPPVSTAEPLPAVTSAAPATPPTPPPAESAPPESAPAATNSAAPSASSSGANAPASTPPPTTAASPTQSPTTPAATRSSPAASAPAPAEAPVTVATPAAPPAPPAPHAPGTGADFNGGTNTSAFLALPGEQYVIELAHGANESDLGGVVPQGRGEVYKLHLHQNGADVWLLVWGSFPDVGAARAARAEITQGTPGWPRRIAPLQAEVRRAGD